MYNEGYEEKGPGEMISRIFLRLLLTLSGLEMYNPVFDSLRKKKWLYP